MNFFGKTWSLLDYNKWLIPSGIVLTKKIAFVSVPETQTGGLSQMSTKTEQYLDEVFQNKVLNARQNEKADRIYAAGRELARAIDENVPSCADKSAALRKVRGALQTARDAIALRAII